MYGESRLIALPVTRVLARSSHPLAPIFRLNGGPGVTNMTFPDASRLAAQHDVVMVGYRGVDGSSVLNCPEVTAALNKSADLLAKASLAGQNATPDTVAAWRINSDWSHAVRSESRRPARRKPAR